jgi:hypothetical protein
VTARSCHYCGQPNGRGPRELRPYGPNGADVCAECTIGAKKTPAREAEAKRQLRGALAGPGPHVLTPDGPKRLSRGGKS